jgi:hypothetical protein
MRKIPSLNNRKRRPLPALMEHQPFLFDGRMRGDGARQGALSDNHHPNAGAIVVPPKASPPGRER